MTQPQATFDEIVRDYGAMIRRIALSYEIAPHLADELVQEIYVAIWRALASFRGEAGIRTFLARIATNRAVTHVARAMRVPRSVELDEQIPSGLASPEHQTIASDRRGRLMTAVRQLPLKYRQPVMLVLEGMTLEEISQVLGITSKCRGSKNVAGKTTFKRIDRRATTMKIDDTYWDDLGVAWRTTNSDLEKAGPQLQARLRRQSFAITGALVLGFPLCCAGIALGVFTIWLGWTTGTWNFVTRGIAIGLVFALLVRALASLLPLRRNRDAQSLSGMLEMAHARTRQTVFLVRTAIVGCVIAAVFGIAGTAIRIRAGSPPHLSPIIDLIIIALVISFLWLYGHSVSVTSRKFEYLRNTLGTNK
jgi:RNA polymerase sigma-70 factor, ECF subfamily